MKLKADDRNRLLKEIGSSFLSLFSLLFLEALARLFESLYLCRHSLGDLNASIYAFTFLNFFQKSLTTFANNDSLFEDKKHATDIGNRIWQIIWISIMSLVLILPLSFLIEKFIFKTPGVGRVAASYFSISTSGIVLFPIVAALSAFYRAQDKQRWVLKGVTITFCVAVFLNLALIPLYHVKGAATASLISKFLFFGILFGYFLSPSNRKQFWTHHWTIDGKAIWKYVRNPPFLFIAFILNLMGYVMMTVCMAHKGYDYLSSLSIGSAMTFFSMCIPNTLYYIFTQLFRKYQQIETAHIFKLGIGASLILGTLLSIPCLFFPNRVVAVFLPNVPSVPDDLYQTLYWVGIWIFTCHLYATPLAFLTSLGKGMLYSKIQLGIILTEVLQILYFIQYLGCQPHVYWMILCGANLILIFAIYLGAYFFNKTMKDKFKQTTQKPHRIL